MSLRPPSLQTTYDDFFSGDPALIPQPVAPAAGEPREAYLKAVDEYLTKLRVARETGDWSGITLEGLAPCKFIMKPITGTMYRTIMDLCGRDTDPMGSGLAHQFAFRAALSSVVDGSLGDGSKFKPTRDPVLGLIAEQKIADFFDSIDIRIVSELGGEALRRITLGPKS